MGHVDPVRSFVRLRARSLFHSNPVREPMRSARVGNSEDQGELRKAFHACLKPYTADSYGVRPLTDTTHTHSQAPHVLSHDVTVHMQLCSLRLYVYRFGGAHIAQPHGPSRHGTPADSHYSQTADATRMRDHASLNERTFVGSHVKESC